MLAGSVLTATEVRRLLEEMSGSSRVPPRRLSYLFPTRR